MYLYAYGRWQLILTYSFGTPARNSDPIVRMAGDEILWIVIEIETGRILAIRQLSGHSALYT